MWYPKVQVGWVSGYKKSERRRERRGKEQGTEREREKVKGHASTSLPHLNITYNGHLLASSISESLGPPDLSRVTLLLKVTMALGTTEAEDLGVIPDKGDSMPWVAS